MEGLLKKEKTVSTNEIIIRWKSIFNTTVTENFFELIYFNSQNVSSYLQFFFKSFIHTIFCPVASPRSPPNVMMGVKHAKYRKKKEATHWMWAASFMSLK